MNNIVSESFGRNLSVLKVIFLYTPNKLNFWFRLRSFVVFSFLMFHVPILDILYFVWEKNIDMKHVSDNGFVLAALCCYVPKLVPFITKANQIQKCIHYFESPSFVKFTRSQTQIMHTASKICRRNSFIFILGLNGAFILWASKPLFSSEYKLPMDVWLPFNVFKDLKLYYATYIWIVLGAGYPAVASAAIEPLISGLACLAAAHLSVLKDNLEHLFEENDYESRQENQEDASQYRQMKIFENIQLCIRHHYAVLEFAKLYEDCFSQVVFSQCFGSIFVLGFCCLRLSMLEPGSGEFLSTLSYFGILLVQIYYYCYYGTSLFEESNTLTDAIYMGKWYEYDLKSQKALIILMEGSKRPIVITAGKILDLSLETFTTILRRAYSLLAVLNSQK